MRNDIAYPLSVAAQRINAWLPDSRKLSRGQIREMAAKGQIASTRTDGGHLRFSDEAIRATMLKLTAPQISLDDFTSFTGACEADEHAVLLAHRLGAELAMQPARAEQLRLDRAAIIADFRSRAVTAETEGRHELSWSLSSRASALEATAYDVIGGVVHVVGAPGSIPPTMPREIIPEHEDDADE